MKKLIEALHVIQEECKKHEEEGCTECPLFGNCVCRVKNLDPCNWKINDNVQKALL